MATLALAEPPATAAQAPQPLEALSCLSSAPHIFLQPTPALHGALLALAKQFLDPLALGVTEAQLRRQREARRLGLGGGGRKRKRKRAAGRAGESSDDEEEEELLRMKRVHVDGLGAEEVWAQARRVLGAAVGEVERVLPAGEGDGEEGEAGVNGHDKKTVRFEDGEDEDMLELDESDAVSGSLGEEGVDWEYDGDDLSAGSDEAEVSAEDLDVKAASDRGDTPASEFSEAEGNDSDGETYVKDKFGLNDGFFSIDQFNKRSEFLERQDAKGDPDDGAASDEEDIDWQADPLSEAAMQPSLKSSKRKAGAAADDGPSDSEDEDEDETGPTFGNMDLNVPEGDSDDGMADDLEASGGMEDLGNTNNILYADFFAPPARKAGTKGSRGANHGKADKVNSRKPVAATEDVPAEDEIEQTIARVHRDLFEDDISEQEEAEEDGEDGDSETGAVSLNPKKSSNLSTHERAQQALRAQIRKLEAENVAKKPWSLAGEAASSARPLNSLLEEDLDFERTGKPVPVITSEISESIEELVKRRILALEFDEVIRRRPTDLVPGLNGAPRRGRVDELSDQKPTQGLADEYADDIARRTDPNAVDHRSNALKRKHAEIEALWTKVSGQLDALSNWHYKPKPAMPAMKIRVDAPTIRMEDARPDTINGEGQSALAPQEVYRPGDGSGGGTGEIMTKGGMAVGRDEMSREQRKRRRRREKERIRKSGEAGKGPEGAKVTPGQGEKNGKRPQKNEVLGQLRKGGVKVIGKSGKVSDIDGQLVQATSHPSGGSFLKL